MYGSSNAPVLSDQQKYGGARGNVFTTKMNRFVDLHRSDKRKVRHIIYYYNSKVILAPGTPFQKNWALLRTSRCDYG